PTVRMCSSSSRAGDDSDASKTGRSTAHRGSGGAPTASTTPSSPAEKSAYFSSSPPGPVTPLGGSRTASADAGDKAGRRLKFAPEHNLELTREYCDFHSGWKRADGRPQFQELMVDASERRFDVVLVYHTSRFARNQVEARRYKQMLRDRLSIRVVSVTQPMG